MKRNQNKIEIRFLINRDPRRGAAESRHLYLSKMIFFIVFSLCFDGPRSWLGPFSDNFLGNFLGTCERPIQPGALPNPVQKDRIFDVHSGGQRVLISGAVPLGRGDLIFPAVPLGMGDLIFGAVPLGRGDPASHPRVPPRSPANRRDRRAVA